MTPSKLLEEKGLFKFLVDLLPFGKGSDDVEENCIQHGLDDQIQQPANVMPGAGDSRPLLQTVSYLDKQVSAFGPGVAQGAAQMAVNMATDTVDLALRSPPGMDALESAGLPTPASFLRSYVEELRGDTNSSIERYTTDWINERGGDPNGPGRGFGRIFGGTGTFALSLLAPQVLGRIGQARAAGALGSSAGSGVPVTANFAQTSFRQAFSKAGAAELSKIAGTPIRTIDDLVAAIRSGAVPASDIPVNYIQRGGNSLILNTRTAQALEQAGVPRSLWNGVNRSGDELFEQLLTDQLKRNQLSPAGTPMAFPE